MSLKFPKKHEGSSNSQSSPNKGHGLRLVHYWISFHSIHCLRYKKFFIPGKFPTLTSAFGHSLVLLSWQHFSCCSMDGFFSGFKSQLDNFLKKTSFEEALYFYNKVSSLYIFQIVICITYVRFAFIFNLSYIFLFSLYIYM